MTGASEDFIITNKLAYFRSGPLKFILYIYNLFFHTNLSNKRPFSSFFQLDNFIFSQNEI